MRIVLAITGASGVVIGARLLQELAATEHELFAILSRNANHVAEHELGTEIPAPASVKLYEDDDYLAPFNSSSFLIDVMIIAPCTMKTLSAIANGYASTLIVRTAENVLRTGKKLILVPRETPLSASALKNMLKLRYEGAIIFPPVVAYYHRPQKVADITNFFVGKILDLIDIPNNLYHRWSEE